MSMPCCPHASSPASHKTRLRNCLVNKKSFKIDWDLKVVKCMCTKKYIQLYKLEHVSMSLNTSQSMFHISQKSAFYKKKNISSPRCRPWGSSPKQLTRWSPPLRSHWWRTRLRHSNRCCSPPLSPEGTGKLSIFWKNWVNGVKGMDSLYVY